MSTLEKSYVISGIEMSIRHSPLGLRTCPRVLLPAPYTSPSSVMSNVCERPHAAETNLAPLAAPTCVGRNVLGSCSETTASVAEDMPRHEEAFRPKRYAVPHLSSITTWQPLCEV